MNDLFFACKTCKLYIDAGYRWATVLPKTIVRGELVDADALFAASEYCNGVAGDERLRLALAEIHEFVKTHRNHELFYGEHQQFHGLDARSLAWVEVGADAERTDIDVVAEQWSPRFFAEKLGYTRWDQVVEHIEGLEEGNWWFNNPELRFEGRQSFECFVRRAANKALP